MTKYTNSKRETTMPRTNMDRDYGKQPRASGGQRSKFRLGGRRLTTIIGGNVSPLNWEWAFPGDIFRGRYQIFARMASPLEFPIFDNIHLTVHTHFVALRNLWDNARKFFGEQVNPGDSIDYTLPVINGSAIDTNSAATTAFADLANHLEVPRRTAAQGGVDGADICAIPFRAYRNIWNYEYRDENMQNSLAEDTDDGPDEWAIQLTLSRGKRFDYFTSLLAAPQKGDAVPVTMDVRTAAPQGGEPGIYSEPLDSYRELDAGAAQIDVSASTSTAGFEMHTEMLITDLRQAAAIQQFLERDNRYGTRFDEILYAHYGVEFNEPRWRPVYLGGGTGNITTTTIAQQTGSSDGGVGDDRKLGELAAIATGTLDGGDFTYAVDEPGIIMTMVSIGADLSYSQGIPRKHLLRTRYDMLWQEFQGIGDRAVPTKEIFYQNNSTDEVVLGYTPRYEEFRTGCNRVSGYFDHNHYDGTLDVMHMAQEFGSAPVLGDLFIRENLLDWQRIMQVSSANQFHLDINCDITVARQLTVSGIPGMTRL